MLPIVPFIIWLIFTGMKLKTFTLFGIAVLLFAACKKDYNDTTLNQKISRQWQIDKYYGGGIDSTLQFGFVFGGYWIDIKTGGNYTERYTPAFSPTRVVNGTWAFLNNGTYFQQVDSSQTRVFTLLSLEDDYLKLKNPNKDQQFWLKPKP